MCLLPFVCCVMNAPQITTLQQSFRMTEEKEMQGYGCWFFLLNICCFSCYLCCSVFISLHCHFRWCSSSCCSSDTLIWLMWVFYDSWTSSSDCHFLSFSIDVGAAGQRGWMDQWPCFLVPPEGLFGGHSQHRWHHSLARTTPAAPVSVGRGLPPGRFKLSTDCHTKVKLFVYYVDASHLFPSSSY